MIAQKITDILVITVYQQIAFSGNLIRNIRMRNLIDGQTIVPLTRVPWKSPHFKTRNSILGNPESPTPMIEKKWFFLTMRDGKSKLTAKTLLINESQKVKPFISLNGSHWRSQPGCFSTYWMKD